jgi:hypothetical protein
MVSRSVSLGIEHPLGAYDQILITVRDLRFYGCGAPYLTRERVCNLLVHLLMSRPSAATLGSKYHRTWGEILLPHLRLGYIFVATYDFEGYGGCILTRLHTAVHVCMIRTWSGSIKRTLSWPPGKDGTQNQDSKFMPGPKWGNFHCRPVRGKVATKMEPTQSQMR